MQEVTLTLRGAVPSKKNSKRRIKRGNHIFMVPSLAHEVWHREQMIAARDWKIKIPGPVIRVFIEFTAGDRRSADLSNKQESIMDLLVDAGVIKDDNWFIVPELGSKLVAVDKERPHATVTIFY